MKYALICLWVFIVLKTGHGQGFLYKEDLPAISLQRTTLEVTEVMVHDVASPPVAARFYAYSLLGGYLAARVFDPQLANVLPDHADSAIKNLELQPGIADQEFTCLYSILETAKRLLPSGALLASNQNDLKHAFLQKGLSPNIFEASRALALAIADKVVTWAKDDGYFSLSSLPRYKPVEGSGYWQPTPPAYMMAVEPQWKTLRTFFLQSPDQFKLVPPTPFDTSKQSTFFQMCNEVFTVSRNLTPQQKLIANYWDCNPFALQYIGHLSVAAKKISPGGHWVNIVGQLCRQKDIALGKALLIHAVVGMGLHDAFVSCWYYKYQTNRLRPETAINVLIDPQWQPLLQTPPFPEYTSGHSVLSTVASELLSALVGEGVHFTDNTGLNYDLPERSFSSFREAAEEAGISRLYGGIHFRDAIENGRAHGKEISRFILDQIKVTATAQLH